MPFLRRRGVMASESDMRKHAFSDRNGASPNDWSSSSLTHSEEHSRPASASGLPSTSAPLSPVQESGPPLVAIPAPPATPPNDGLPSSSPSRPTLSTSASDLFARPESPPIQEETPKHRRFSMLRFRNASDSQLATRAKQHAALEKPPPVPRPPEIITTAPTVDLTAPQKKHSRIRLPSRPRKSGEESRSEKWGSLGRASDPDKIRRTTMIPQGEESRKQSVTFDEVPRPKTSNPPGVDGNDEEGTGSLAIPGNRLSESSRSDGSSGNHQYYGSTTTTTRTTHTTTTFFRLRRKPKQPVPLFPISHLKSNHSTTAESFGSNSSVSAATPDLSMSNGSPSRSASQRTPTTSRPSSVHDLATPPGHTAGLSFLGKSGSPATALFRPNSRNSGQSSPTRAHLHLRGRSSTLSSLGRNSPRPSVDEHLAPPTLRTSSSTGRKSFGDLLGLSRMRQDSQSNGRGGNLTPATPGSSASKNNSFQLQRGSIVLPERRDDDTPAKYLARLEEVVSRSVIAAAVSKGTDQFSQAVLRSYMRSFSFFGHPMDMAIRKLLMEAELPKETQQIDRFLQAFANRYHECNPGIYSSADQAYFIAFSLLILHTDVFNKNNKHKMQKADYLKNTQGEGIFQEILEVFYDNITYTPFIHVEDDLDINGERIVAHKSKKKSIFPSASPDTAKKALKEPIDPYTLIIDERLDILRPNLKDVMHLEDHYSYLGTAQSLNLKELQSTFFKTGILQIISARSRPDAFMTEQTATNPDGAHPGIVDIKITKVGLLWRKDPKKKKTRSPWQEWGAILTGAQLYFFRNTGWIKNLMHQYETHVKQGHEGMPVIFKPPLENFKPDALMSTDGAVALVDSTYKKHKHAFTYVRHGGFEEVLLADNEEEMNDWLAKLNYAAAFRTSGVRMRGVVGGGYDGQGRRAIRRLDSDVDTVQTPSGEVMISRSKIDHQMVQDILTARRDIMSQKIAHAEERLYGLNKQLDLQLRNARHLQILAPIHPKTREHMLLSAAKLAAQLKWTRVDMWKIRCHRDILVSDLEEERQLLGLPQDSPKPEAPGPRENRPTTPTETRSSVAAASPHSLRPPARLALTRTSTAPVKPDDDSPLTDIFQTPPTSATDTSFHRPRNSWELPNLSFDTVGLRKGSVSSVVSSNHSITATPPRKIRSSSSAPAAERVATDGGADVDADERDLLELAGLIGSAQKAQPDPRIPKSTVDTEDGREPHSSPVSDRNKIRRSLQRTLREGAGHISHVRSRRGRDSMSGAAASEETKVDSSIDSPDFLTRGSGSFVVHGKKASVITFGTELHNLTPDEHLRLQRNRALQAAQSDVANGSSSSSAAAAISPSLGETTGTPDYRVVLGAAARRAASRHDHERRESAASASTATARSFRELHRKYSSAQAAARSASASAHSMGTLTVPSDTDSEVAVSLSEGRRSPLPPIDGGSEAGETRSDADDSSDDERDDGEGRHKPRTQFFTPDPPASPAVDVFAAGNGNGKDEEGRGRLQTDAEKRAPSANGGGSHSDRLPSPPLQVVSA